MYGKHRRLSTSESANIANHMILSHLLCAMHIVPGVGGGVAALSRCGFRSGRYLEVKILVKKRSGPRSVSAVWSLEVVASRRLAMYFKYGILSRDLKLHLL